MLVCPQFPCCKSLYKSMNEFFLCIFSLKLLLKLSLVVVQDSQIWLNQLYSIMLHHESQKIKLSMKLLLKNSITIPSSPQMNYISSTTSLG